MINFHKRVPTLYKYLPCKYANLALSEGRLRVGTLSDFRRVEIYDEERGDADEGTITRYIDDNIYGKPNAQQASIIPSWLHLENVSIENCGQSISIRNSILDMYVYCLSLEKSAKIMRDFGADVCLEIRDGEGFIRSLTRQVRKKGVAWVAGGPCQYGKREFSHREDPVQCEPFLLKSPKYSSQKEFRIAWYKEGLRLEPFEIVCPEVTTLMKPVPVHI